MPQTVDVWRKTYTVRSSETDVAGRASVQALLGYLLDAADGHARTLGFSADDFAAAQRTWMLHRLRVVVDVAPRWRDEIEIETWPSAMDGLYGQREFWLRGGDGQVFARATSTWLVIDLKRRRPVRLPEALRTLDLPNHERPLPDDETDVPPLDAPDYERTFRVGYSDLDMNRHATFSRYALWAIETLPFEMLQAHTLAELDLHFRAETLYGDVVRAETQQVATDGAPAFLHRLTRKDDGREVAMARTRWQPAQAS